MINELFLNFVKSNVDEVLTAIKDDKTPYLYTFKEDDTWLFDKSYLIKV